MKLLKIGRYRISNSLLAGFIALLLLLGFCITIINLCLSYLQGKFLRLVFDSGFEVSEGISNNLNNSICIYSMTG